MTDHRHGEREQRELLRHFLAALAYRTQKALRDASPEFHAFRVRPGVRTPAELVRHMTSVLGYARTFIRGGTYTADALSSFEQEIDRFHAMLRDLSNDLDAGRPFLDTTPERILQGPLADAMTHAGQLAMLRRLYGEPVAPENFLKANVDSANVSRDQPSPAAWGRRDGTWDPRGMPDDTERRT